MSPRAVGLIAGVVAAMAVALALPPDDLMLLIFGTLGLVVLFCALGWLIGGQLSQPPADEDADQETEPPRPPARHVFVGAGAAILVVVVFAAPVASASSLIAGFALLAAAAVAGVGAAAAAKRFWKP